MFVVPRNIICADTPEFPTSWNAPGVMSELAAEDVLAARAKREGDPARMASSRCLAALSSGGRTPDDARAKGASRRAREIVLCIVMMREDVDMLAGGLEWFGTLKECVYYKERGGGGRGTSIVAIKTVHLTDRLGVSRRTIGFFLGRKDTIGMSRMRWVFRYGSKAERMDDCVWCLCPR